MKSVQIKKNIALFSFTIVLVILIAFQQNEFSFIASIPEKATHITTDHLGNVYTLSGNGLKKYNSEGNQLKTFSNKNIGSLTLIDASNPLKILLFYPSFQEIIFLDNMLSPTGNPVLLETLGYRQISLACISENNGFWVFNKQTSELIKFNNQLQKVFQSGNINQVAGYNNMNPTFLAEQNNHVFLCDSAIGILLFDNFGTFHKVIPIKKVEHFQLSNQTIIYFQNKKLKSYHLQTFQEAEMFIPDSNAIIARSEKEKLYLLKQNSIEIYRLKK
jgi:hypothetical protein